MSNKEAINNVIQERLSHQVIGPILLSLPVTYWEITIQALDVTTKASVRIAEIKALNASGTFDYRWPIVFVAGFFYLIFLPLLTERYEEYFRQFSIRKLAEELRAKRLAEWDASVGENLERVVLDYIDFVNNSLEYIRTHHNLGPQPVLWNLVEKLNNKKAEFAVLQTLPRPTTTQHPTETINRLNLLRTKIMNALKPKK